jgi:hypothetical protein
VQVVDDGLRDDRPHPVGAAATIFVDAAGGVAVIYQDAADNDLLLARKNGDTWTREDLLVGDDGYGFYNAQASDGTASWIGTYTYDRTKYPPGEVVIRKL